MKHLILALTIACTTMSFAQKECKLTVNYSFKNIQEGYDHKTKTMVYVDGAIAAESTEHVQSMPTKISVAVPRGKYEVRVINMTYYEGKWEERSIANGYSTEGEYKENILLSKKKSITLVFDLNQADPIITVK